MMKNLDVATVLTLRDQVQQNASVSSGKDAGKSGGSSAAK